MTGFLPSKNKRVRPPQRTSDYRKKKRAYRLGHWAEWRSILYLKLRGYHLVAQRYRNAMGEIDLIFRRGKILVMVEVKARRKNTTSELITKHQQQRIVRAAALFIAKHPKFSHYALRFDVIIVRSWYRLQHVKHAWITERTAL